MVSTTMADLAQYLLREMSQRGLTQHKAAELSHIPRSTLADLLNNPDKTPELKTLAGLAKGFDVPLRRLIQLAGFSFDDEKDEAMFSSLTEEERRAFSELTPEQRRAAVEIARTMRSGIQS